MIRYATTIVVVLLAGIAAVISYRHGLAVVEHYGQSQLNAVLTPLTVDGMVFVSSMVLLDSARRDLPTPKLAGLDARARDRGHADDERPRRPVGRPGRRGHRRVACGCSRAVVRVVDGSHQARKRYSCNAR